MKPQLPESLTGALSSLPSEPGVYLFKDKDGQTIYVGKASSLRSRVRSYWRDNAWMERPKLAVLMPKVMSVDVIITNSEKEALLLEANLIRQHMPRFNVALKDDKRYPWLAITYDEDFPRLIMVRDPTRYRKTHPKAKVFGPYVEAGAMWETLRILRKVFPLRQQKKPPFSDRPCLNYYIGLCLAPCQKLVEPDDYQRLLTQTEMFLSGRQAEVTHQLTQEMDRLSERCEFEQAAKIRDRLRLLEKVIETQQVVFKNPKVSQDILSAATTERLMAICLIKIREGKLTSSESFNLPLPDKTDSLEAFQAFIDQYYTSLEPISLPSEILLGKDFNDSKPLSEILSQRAGHKVTVTVPRRGQKLHLIEMAEKNAAQSLDKEARQAESEELQAREMLSVLKEELGLAKVPRRIECFDISNIQGTDNVASMVVFENGRPKRSDYRHFKVRSVEGEPDDFQSMAEVVSRRYSRLKTEGKPMPDLIVIDGGKGQLNAALASLYQLGLEEIETLGLAKKHEEIYRPGRKDPINLSRRSVALLLLQRVRDEAHRFAVSFHRKLRAKRSIKSDLVSLPGVGKARAKLLLDHFDSFSKLKDATVDELKRVPGISTKLAGLLFQALHNA